MQIQKTIKAKIIGLTNTKREKIEREYSNFQSALKGEDVELYSATKQQAERLLWKLRKSKHFGEQPLIIRRDLIKIERQDTKLSKFWGRVPIYKKSIWVAIEFPNNQEQLLKCSIRETKLVKKNDNWFLLITVQKDVKLKKKYDKVLAVDLGEKRIATSVEFDGVSMSSPKFYGKEVRGIRRHYSWLRKRLGERKLLRTIKKIKHTEKRKVDDCLHKISRQIVNEAKESNSVIVLGDLRGIRKSAKGRRMNRIVSNMPYYKLTQYIEYKANWEGIEVVKINERGTSHICHRCSSEGKRPTQGLFKCHNCNLEYNADLNGAINIAKMFFEQSLKNGASLITPKTQKGEAK